MEQEIPRPRVTSRGYTLYYKERYLLSPRDAQGGCERVVGTLPLKEDTLYLLASPLFGYGLPRLVARLPKGSALLCVELDPLLYRATFKEFCDFCREIPSVPYLCNPSPEDLLHFVRTTWGPRRFRRVELLHITGGWQIHPTGYQEIVAFLEESIALDWFNAMTLTKLGRRYARNFIHNVALLPQGYDARSLSWGNIPVLLCGAGPSLDETLSSLVHVIPLVKDKKKRPLRIICVDTALRTLLFYGIIPDLVVVQEAQWWNLRDFVGIKEGDFAFLLDLCSLPTVPRLSVFKETPRYVFYTPWTYLRLFSRLGNQNLLPLEIPPLGSVGLTMLALARQISTGPLFIAGLDFSYTIEQFHCKEAPGFLESQFHLTRFVSPIRGERCFREKSRPMSHPFLALRTDPALVRYQHIGMRHFAHLSGIFDIRPWGLPLGFPRLTIAECSALLSEGMLYSTGEPKEGSKTSAFPSTFSWSRGKVEQFLKDEKKALERLVMLLQGVKRTSSGELERLLSDLDYLWAHFPEWAGREETIPPTQDISFLKRVRAETDFFIKTVELALEELEPEKNTLEFWGS
ncbi:MAG: DUF115 domain-containing protein [Treponemataceae bacterium]|nr:DUF115 domain-containing protein [Treponemataceae bacterium]